MPNVRIASPDDVAGIVRVYMESALHHQSLDPDLYHLPEEDVIYRRYHERMTHPEWATGNLRTFVAIEEGLEGFVDAQIVRPTDAMLRTSLYCHVSELAVSAGRRGHGVGTALLRTAEDWGRQRGAQAASLEFNVHNARAEKFYRQHMGYRVASITVVKELSGQQARASSRTPPS